MSVLVTGLCSLEWGRMEFGNVGNSYVSHGFFKMLRRHMPQTRIVTTLQFSDQFLSLYQLESTSMDIFIDNPFNAEAELLEAKRRAGLANHLEVRGGMFTSKYLDVLDTVDTVLDLSGDIWGDNALFLSTSRLRVALLKIQTAQILGKKTALVASSPGPFERLTLEDLSLARKVYASFDLVLNREAQSFNVLRESGFDVTRTKSLACPSVLFQSSKQSSSSEGRLDKTKPQIGMSICGWNFLEGPFNKEPRERQEFKPFVEMLKIMLATTEAEIILFSHSNGFSREGGKVQHKSGRDFVLVEQLYEELLSTGFDSKVRLSDEFRTVRQTHQFIGELDMLVAGRAHAAVAALSQGVPTIMIDYGHGPIAHKTRGFLELYGKEDWLVEPSNLKRFEQVLRRSWASLEVVSENLTNQHKFVLSLVEEMGNYISNLASLDSGELN
jgi:colanic acid/amylovoran biosynthesis protein